MGAAMRPVKKMKAKRSPSVMVPWTIARPPTRIITMPTAPMTTLEKAVVAETPVIDLAMFRKSLCAPLVKIRSSRRSAV
jgi:hypothetical protein